MDYVFCHRVRICIFRVLFLLAGFSLMPLAFADNGNGYAICSNYANSNSGLSFPYSNTVSADIYESGWQPKEYWWVNHNGYQCELIHDGATVCSSHPDDGFFTCHFDYILTGRLYTGENPSDLYVVDDPSLNPSNPYMGSNGGFSSSMSCGEGTHVYAPFPPGYRYVPFDGFKYFYSDGWSDCIMWASMDAFSNDDSGYYSVPAVEVKSYTWSKDHHGSYNNCESLDDACLVVILMIYPDDGYDDYAHPYDFHERFYARCPPNSSFSPVHGACYALIADDLLKGSTIQESDLFASPDGGTSIEVNFNQVDFISQVSKPGIHQCPSPLTTTFMGQQITFFDYTDSCQILADYVKPFILLLGTFVSIAIVLGISTATVTES